MMADTIRAITPVSSCDPVTGQTGRCPFCAGLIALSALTTGRTRCRGCHAVFTAAGRAILPPVEDLLRGRRPDRPEPARTLLKGRRA